MHWIKFPTHDFSTLANIPASKSRDEERINGVVFRKGETNCHDSINKQNSDRRVKVKFMIKGEDCETWNLSYL